MSDRSRGSRSPNSNSPIQKVTRVERGQAVYLNLSPQRYLQYRQEGTASEAHRNVFLREVLSVASPRVRVTVDGHALRNCEVTTWRKPDRTYLFVLQKAATGGDPTGGNWGTALQEAELPIEVAFSSPVKDVAQRTNR